MTDQEELTNEMISMFYEKPEFGNCELCGTYDKLVPGEKWCYLCNEMTDDCLERLRNNICIIDFSGCVIRSNSMEGKMGEQCYLSLKWGTLKGWNFEGNEEAIELLKRYHEIGASFSAMLQKDTLEQKEIICKLIDLVPGEIHLEWDDKYVSKEDAKKYVLDFGNISVASNDSPEGDTSQK